MQTLTEKKPDAIAEGLSKVYDLAIDHAIETVRNHYSGDLMVYRVNSTNDVLDQIVQKLKALKK